MVDSLSEDIVYINKENTEYIQFKKLLKYPEIEHCYTLRNNDLSFSVHNGEEILQKSYDKICNALKLDKTNMLKPHQTHTDRVEIVEDTQKYYDNVDGVITNKRNIILCTTSADCTSLLFYDPIKKVIADVHSGWRGTIQKIGQKAVQKMIEKYECKPEDIICCICPHIRKCHFEVEDDVMHLFKSKFKYTGKISQIIKEGRKIDGVQKYNIDTTLINTLILKEIGIADENIIDSNICTVCESDKFHSYRVDKENSGRNAAIITLK